MPLIHTDELLYFRMSNGQWVIGRVINDDVAGEGEVFQVRAPMQVDHAISHNGDLGMQMIPFCPGDPDAVTDVFQDSLSVVAENIPDSVERRYIQLTTNIQLAH